jgi:hypothetical protein
MMVMKRYFFWDMILCSPLKVKGRRISQVRNQLVELTNCFDAGYLIGLFLDPNVEATRFSESWLTFDILHGVIFHNAELFFFGC